MQRRVALYRCDQRHRPPVPRAPGRQGLALHPDSVPRGSGLPGGMRQPVPSPVARVRRQVSEPPPKGRAHPDVYSQPYRDAARKLE